MEILMGFLVETHVGADKKRRHNRLNKGRMDLEYLKQVQEELLSKKLALEKATSASAQLEGELSRRSETTSAYLVDNFVSTKMKHFPLKGVLLKLESAL
ncbi:hypothetical protein Tco_1225683 [Tanacetum coccineum]